jgi:hypothetical protein
MLGDRCQVGYVGRSGRVGRVGDLLGLAFPTLGSIYAAGHVADPVVMGEHAAVVRGRVLSCGRALFGRIALRLVALVWRGKSFEDSTKVGHDEGRGLWPRFRATFRWRFGFSQLDGKPATLLRYADAGLRNGWPLTMLAGELRVVGPGLAIGPAFIGRGARTRVLFWWGFEW